MARDDPTIYMRIPADLKDQLDAAAASNRRSLTAEVVARLSISFEHKSSESSDLVGQIRQLIAHGQFDTWTTKMSAGTIGRLALAFAEVEKLENDALAGFKQDLLALLQEYSKEAIIEGHKASSSVFSSLNKAAAEANYPPGTGAALLPRVLEIFKASWGDATRDPILNGKWAQHLQDPAGLKLQDVVDMKLSPPTPNSTYAVYTGEEVEETDHQRVLKHRTVDGPSDPRVRLKTGKASPPQTEQLGFKSQKQRGLADATPASSTGAAGFKSAEHRHSLADALPATKPGGAPGLSDASTATGAGSKPLKQGPGLADAEPARSPKGPGLASSKRAKSPK